jgi:hypothetical protein
MMNNRLGSLQNIEDIIRYNAYCHTCHLTALPSIAE